jgi:hypothetical protein
MVRYEQHNAAVREYFADRPDDLLELCLDCDVKEANGGKDPESALRAFLGCPTSLEPFVKAKEAAPAWNHRFFSEEDLAAGITDWSRFPEPVFKAGAKGPPQFPDLVTPLLEQKLGDSNATADSATPTTSSPTTALPTTASPITASSIASPTTHVGGEPSPQVRSQSPPLL